MDKKDKARVNWSREETILAYDLYCRTTFGNIKVDNPEIVELSKIIGRSPGSVKAKMNNLAHYDPELQERKIEAMSHASKLDEEIVTEFLNDWEDLSYQAQMIRAKMANKNISNFIPVEDFEKFPAGESREQIIKARVGQYFFRMSVLNSYENRCCITGINLPELLIASHIKPWNKSDVQTERANPHNGLCLNSLHDKAFDRGFITIDQNYKLVISEKIYKTDMDSETKSWLISYDKKCIRLPKKFLPGKDFIEYHNDVIFQR